jgi:predicted dehydrogenase
MQSSPLTLAQLGCGYWGPNLLRNYSALPDCWVKVVVDASAERRAFVEANFPRSTTSETPDTVFQDPSIQAVIIATPAGTHFELARQALLAGKHVFVEKPLATKVSEVDELARLAAERNLVVMAGHTFIYNAAVRYVKTLIDSGELGEVRYIYSQRLNLGRIRSDIDALWNFAPHDISIIQYWLGNPEPLSVVRQGMDYIQDGVEDVVFLGVTYPNKIMANIHVSWLDPQKVRKMIVVGSKKMVVYDDVAEDKIAIYDKGIDKKAILGQNMDFDAPPPPQFSYRSGDILLPQVKFVEPLRTESQHFVDCIRKGSTPMTGLAHARTVVGILERAYAGSTREV